MIGADLESRVVSSLRPHKTLLSRTFTWTLRSDSTTSPPEQSEGAAPASSGSATGFGHVPHPLAVAEHDAVPAVTLIYLPVQGPGR